LPHVAQVHPDWIKVIPPLADGSDGGMFMDMGYPEAREYLVTLAMEMVRNYDIDAILFDYIRYHDRIDINWDASTVQAYKPDNMSLADWRRENINMFVREIYDSIKAIKPCLKVASTPVGVYAAGILGVGPELYGYSDCYCDSKRWLQEEKHDYLAPQIYWALSYPQTASPYNRILPDWLKDRNGRHIYAALAAYKPEVYPELADIIQFTRTRQGHGNVFFSQSDVAPRDYAAIKSVYLYPTNIPAMPWIDSIPPAIPQNLAITKIDDKTWNLTWDKAAPGADGDVAKYYNIYRSPWTVTDYEDGANLYHITTNDDNSFTVNFDEPPDSNYYFTVTALDRNNVESAPSNVAPLLITDVADLEKPATFKLEQNYPNPFNPTTNIAYHISSRANVRLSVYNVLGQEISVIADEVKDAGDYLVKFDAANLPTGVYIYKIDVSAGSQRFIDHKKMLLTK
jgi:hypothetical protein